MKENQIDHDTGTEMKPNNGLWETHNPAFIGRVNRSVQPPTVSLFETYHNHPAIFLSLHFVFQSTLTIHPKTINNL